MWTFASAMFGPKWRLQPHRRFHSRVRSNRQACFSSRVGTTSRRNSRICSKPSARYAGVVADLWLSIENVVAMLWHSYTHVHPTMQCYPRQPGSLKLVNDFCTVYRLLIYLLQFHPGARYDPRRQLSSDKRQTDLNMAYRS